MMERRHGGLEFQELFTGDDIELDNARAHELTPQQVEAVTNAHGSHG